MKNVLFVAHDGPGQESRLQCALDVVRAMEGHLNCLDIVIPPVVAGDAMSGMAMVQSAVIEQAVAAEQANRARIEPRLVAEGIPYSWLDTTGPAADSIEAHAKLNDLIVVGSESPAGSPDRFDIAARIVKRVRRPVLAVPRDAKALDLFGTVLVAWDGSETADAALRASVPLLHLAKRVVIVSVGNGMHPGPEDAAAYCSRQCVSAEVEILPSGFDKTGRTILVFAQAVRAALIVMGAYGHSKLREDAFGGVTRTMIEESGIPLFLAH